MTNPFGMPWLLPRPNDFQARVHSLTNSESLDGSEVRRLAAFSLDLIELRTLNNFIYKQREFLISDAGYTPVKIGIVSSHTINYLAEALPGTGLRYGLIIDVVLAGYGQVPQQLLDPASNFSSQQLNAVLIALDYRALGLGRVRVRNEDASNAVTSALSYIASIAAGARDVLKATCILQTLVPPSNPVFGSFDVRIPGSPRAMIERFNLRLIQDIVTPNDLLLDAASLASQAGLNVWNNALEWHKAKLSVPLDAIPLYADHICRLIGAAYGKARKCLVLDLDNTIWGGEIGDDGVNGIALGQNSPVGEAYVELQQFILDLRKRGVILAVCSKNEDANARIPFREHPEMVLKEDHIAVFIANWLDKPNNLREVAATLNTSVDSLVFLDDDPVERAQVQQVLPEIAVPELTGNPANYISILANAGYFEAVGLSYEDIFRADLYHSNAERVAIEKISKPEDFLYWLQMVATVSPCKVADHLRITQLINRSNQFNLTTRRYLRDEIESFEQLSTKYCLQVRLSDRFGDNGIISIVIYDKFSTEWICDTWVMSCRVLGRRIEELVLATVAQAAKEAGAKQLIGKYVPTKKNGLVAQLYAKLGFTKTSDCSDGSTIWALQLDDYQPPELQIHVIQAT